MGVRTPQLETEIIAILPRLRRFARSLTRDAADADDLVQITLEKALNKLDQWQTGTRLDSWMYRIMKNAWIDEVRFRQRQSERFAPEALGEAVGRDDPGYEKRLRALEIDRAMQTLPDDQRLAVALVLVEGLAYKEAAAVLDIPIGTLTSRLARGRTALETLLNPQAGET